MPLRGANLENNLPYLQNLLKRNPSLYEEEFNQQWRHYASLREIFLHQPDSEKDVFLDQMQFIAQVSACYPERAVQFAEQLLELLRLHHDQLSANVRDTIVLCLTLVYRRGSISPEFVLESLFFLFKNSSSKTFRQTLNTRIVSILKSENRKSKNEKISKLTCTFLLNLITTETSSENEYGLAAVDLAKDLWNHGILKGDTRIIEMMRHACIFAKGKMLFCAMHFFLGDEIERDEEDSDEGDADRKMEVEKFKHKSDVNKKTRSRLKKSKKLKIAALKTYKSSIDPNFTALQSVYDPQSFCEQIFSRHLRDFKSRLPASHRLIAIQLVARLISVHKLLLLDFYDYMKRFLNPKQYETTRYLAYVAQASHDYVPPDELFKVVRHIADNFITTGVSSEVLIAGLNAIREICVRQPLAITEELLQDLSEYQSSRDKSTVMASRGLISLYRKIAPEMLSKRHRGRDASVQLQRKKSETGKNDVNTQLIYGIDHSAIHGFQELPMKAFISTGEAIENENDNSSSNFQSNGGLAENRDDHNGHVSGDKGHVTEEDDEEDTGGENDEEDDEYNEDSDDNAVTNESESYNEAESDEIESRSDKKAEGFEMLEEYMKSNILSDEQLEKLREIAARESVKKSVRFQDEVIDLSAIEGQRKWKQNKEERIASIKSGREGREKFGSKKGKKKQLKPSSTTNKEKRKTKSFLMVLQKRGKGKKGRNLAHGQKKLKAQSKR